MNLKHLGLQSTGTNVFANVWSKIKDGRFWQSRGRPQQRTQGKHLCSWAAVLKLPPQKRKTHFFLFETDRGNMNCNARQSRENLGCIIVASPLYTGMKHSPATNMFKNFSPDEHFLSVYYDSSQQNPCTHVQSYMHIQS